MKRIRVGQHAKGPILPDSYRQWLLKENNIKAAMFKDGDPGPDWLKLFMKHNKLSFKKANMISAARKSATSNPFIIYDFYNQLDEIVT